MCRSVHTFNTRADDRVCVCETRTAPDYMGMKCLGSHICFHVIGEVRGQQGGEELGEQGVVVAVGINTVCVCVNISHCVCWNGGFR